MCDDFIQRCEVCRATLAVCHLCGYAYAWCLDHGPAGLACPNCKARPMDNQPGKTMTPERFDELTLQANDIMREMLDEIARLAEMVYVPGGWHCPTCGFRLVSSVLYAKTGNVAASHKIPEPCPNDGTPLQPDTWRQDAIDMADKMPFALRMMRIDDLRENEGASVNVLCDNPDGAPNNAIEVCDDWTGWEPRRFEGDTLMRALNAAFEEKRHAQDLRP